MPSASLSVSVSIPAPAANVYTSASNLVWQTDKAKISTGTTPVTYQVYLYPAFTDTMYSNPIQVPANSSEDIQVCVGNKITVTGASFTISEIGTTSSGTAGVNAIT
jgi:hypothetical protein